MNRHQARETAFRMIFQMDLAKMNMKPRKKQCGEAIADGYISTEDCPYIEDVVQGVRRKRAALDDFIMAHAKGWKLERINPVDRNLIRLCLYEIQYLKDVPLKSP